MVLQMKQLRVIISSFHTFIKLTQKPSIMYLFIRSVELSDTRLRPSSSEFCGPQRSTTVAAGTYLYRNIIPTAKLKLELELAVGPSSLYCHSHESHSSFGLHLACRRFTLSSHTH